MEIWKDIPNYEGCYQVSNLGNVKSLERKVKGKVNLKTQKEKILNPTQNIYGYYYVSLCKKGFIKKFTVHQLVAISFLNHIPCGMKLVVNHINFNRLDNRLENIEVVTNRENTNLKHIKSSSKYVGVSWHKGSKKWMSRIVINGKRKHLGYFFEEIEAHNAYKKELLQ